MLPSSCAKRTTSACCGVTASEHDHCGPRARWRIRVVGVGGWRSDRGQHLDVLDDDLDRRVVQEVIDGDVWVRRVAGTRRWAWPGDRRPGSGRRDRHRKQNVDEVAGLQSPATEFDFGERDGDGAQTWLAATETSSGTVSSVSKSAVWSAAPWATVPAHDLAHDLLWVLIGVGGLRSAAWSWWTASSAVTCVPRAGRQRRQRRGRRAPARRWRLARRNRRRRGLPRTTQLQEPRRLRASTDWSASK